jgi:hypothetical protein
MTRGELVKRSKEKITNLYYTNGGINPAGAMNKTQLNLGVREGLNFSSLY